MNNQRTSLRLTTGLVILGLVAMMLSGCPDMLGNNGNPGGGTPPGDPPEEMDLTMDGFAGGITTADLAPGTPLSVTGVAKDATGTPAIAVTINGAPATIGADGAFSHDVDTQFGITPIEILVTDSGGGTATYLWFALVSEIWLPEAEPMGLATQIHLLPGALDDSVRSSTIDSFADLYFEMMNSAEPNLFTEVDEACMANNPWYSDTVPVVGTVEVNYTGLNADMVHDAALQLLTDQLRVSLTINGAELYYDIEPAVGIFPSAVATVTLSTVTIDIDHSLSVSPSGELTVATASVDADASGISVDVDNAIYGILTGVLATSVDGILEDAVATALSVVLAPLSEAILETLGVGLQSIAVNVPAVGGTTKPLAWSAGLSESSVSPSSLWIGLASSASMDVVRSDVLPGIPAIVAPSQHIGLSTGPAILSVHSAAINQVLLALWRGGCLDGSVGDSLPSAPAGSEVDLSFPLPPVAELVGSSGIEVTAAVGIDIVTLPGILAVPTSLDAYLRCSGTADIVGEACVISSFAVDALVIVADPEIPAGAAAAVEGLIAEAAEVALADAIFVAIPPAPLALVNVPSESAPVGFPAGTVVSLTTTSLLVDGQVLEVSGTVVGD